MTTIYQAYDLMTSSRQAAVKCDQCSARASIVINPGSTFEENWNELADTLNLYGWDFDLTPEGHCLCSRHGGKS